MRKTYGDWILLIYVGVMLIFLVAPLIVVIGISFNEGAVFKFPPEGFSLRWYKWVFQRAHIVRALRNSAILATFTAIVSTSLGIVTTYTLHRYKFRGRDLIMLLILAPLLLPRVITGMSMLISSSRIGMMSSPFILALAHLLITLPFSVRIISAALPNLDMAYEEAAMILGASRLYTFYKILIPLLKPAIVSSILFVFVASFSDTGASIFLASQKSEPIAVALFRYFDTGQDPGVAALSVVFIGLAIIVILGIGKFVKLEIVM